VSPRDYVSVLYIGSELYRARASNPLGERRRTKPGHGRQNDEVRQ
jgi:hypothetical protein